MMGFVFGTVCLIALAKMARRGWGHHHGWGYGHGGGCGDSSGCGSGWRGHHGHGRHSWHDRGGPGAGSSWGGGFGANAESFILRRVYERLETTPGQERVIAEAVREMRENGGKSFETLRASREDIARAMKTENFDETALGESIARQDEALESLRKTAIGALARVHAALEPKQREILADMIARGPSGFGRGGFGNPWNA